MVSTLSPPSTDSVLTGNPLQDVLRDQRAPAYSTPDIHWTPEASRRNVRSQ
jgi:hypothetical protein